MTAEAESAYAKERIQQTKGPISEEGLLVFSPVQHVQCLPVSGPIRNNCCLLDLSLAARRLISRMADLVSLLEAEERGWKGRREPR